MLIRHSIYYSIARGLPGLVSVAALAVYTRLLSTEEFGRYALVLAGVGLANVVLFQWLRLVLTRFLQAYNDDPERLLSTVLALFLTLGACVAALGFACAWWCVNPAWRGPAVLAVILLHTQAWFELNLALAAAQLRPAWYGRMLVSKALLSLSIGGALAWTGLGTAAPVIGIIVAQLLAFAVFGAPAWRGVSPRWPKISVLRSQLRYGLPLTVTFALEWVISGFARVAISWFLNEHAVGVYAAGYDLTFQSITLLLSIINTAALPLAVQALERRGPAACSTQLSKNGSLIMAAAAAGAAGVIALGPQLVGLVIGETFRAEAESILWIIAIASGIAGVKAFHFDIAFYLGKNTYILAAINGGAAALNIALNLILIPRYGIFGAAWATTGAYAMGLVASAVATRSVFPLPSASPMAAKAAVLAIAVAMVGRVACEVTDTQWIQLSLGTASVAIVALLGSLVLNVAGMRDASLTYWKGKRSGCHRLRNE